MSEALLLAFALLFVVALLLGLVATSLARRLALKINLVDHPGDRKIHATVTPYGGGLAIYSVTMLLLCGAYVISLWGHALPIWPGLRESLLHHGPGLRATQTFARFGSMLLGGTLLFAVGLVDDKRGMSARIKLTFQFLAALLVALGGIRATLFIQNEFVSIAITVFWIVLVTNAFNLLDNMDGLSSGVACIAASLLLVITLQTEQIFVSAVLVVLLGTTLGFLWHNFPPAKLFLGDAGSLFLGFLLGCLTVSGTYFAGSGNLFTVVTPLLILGVPLFDTLSVVVIRLRAGKPIYIGDTNHLSHRLVRLGLTRRGAVLTIYLLALILGGAATLLPQLDTAGSIVVFLIGLGIISLIALLEYAVALRDRTQMTPSASPDESDAPPADPPDA